jgi:hypothetical protein
MSALLLVTLLAGRLAIVSSASLADGQAPLRYADVDGNRVADVLRELGAFQSVWRLQQPSAGELRAALARVRDTARVDPDLEVVFYYSGHSDEQGLLLGSERFAYSELRQGLERSGAALRVALLDGCHSGGAVNPKGGRPSPGFSLSVLTPTHVRGAAIITASSSTEAAQESAAVGGSYFTYHLLSALRGAGDRNDNGQVTLSEAYQYAYSHTVATTVASSFGPQHPSYEYSLAGTGDLVLTDVRATGSGMLLDDPASGSYVITGEDDVVGEVTIPVGKRVSVALKPGQYRVVLRQSGRVRSGDFLLRPGQSLFVSPSDLHDIDPTLALGKGVGRSHTTEVVAGYRLSTLAWIPLRTRGALSAGVLRHARTISMGAHVAYESFERLHDGTEWVHYQLYKVSFTGELLRRFDFRRLSLEAGAEGGATLIIQESFRAGIAGRQVAPLLTANIGIAVPLLANVTFRAAFRGGGHLVTYHPSSLAVIPEATVGAAMGMVF